MSKQMLVTLPFLLLLLDYWPFGRFGSRPGTWRRLVVEKVPFFALAAVSSVVALLAQHQGGAVSDLERSPFGPRVANAIVAYVVYLGQTVWPQWLACFYPHWANGVSAIAAAGSALLLALATAALVLQARHRPYLAVGWLWFLGCLVPVIGLVQIGAQRMADRYTYWPLTGLFIAVVWFVPSPRQDAHRRRVVLVLATAALIVAFAVVAWNQAGTWRDTETVWRHAIAVTRDNYRAHNNLGAALGAEGRHEEAVYHFGQALESQPEYASAHGNLGKALDLQGRFDEAVGHFRRAVEIDPDLVSARVNWAIALSRRGRLEEAILQFRAAIEADPDNPAVRQLLGEAHQAYGVTLLRQGRRDQAAAQFREALRIDPELTLAREFLSTFQD
jgi:tetratricopeptide (TPR) repeat protein